MQHNTLNGTKDKTIVLKLAMLMLDKIQVSMDAIKKVSINKVADASPVCSGKDEIMPVLQGMDASPVIIAKRLRKKSRLKIVGVPVIHCSKRPISITNNCNRIIILSS